MKFGDNIDKRILIPFLSSAMKKTILISVLLTALAFASPLGLPAQDAGKKSEGRELIKALEKKTRMSATNEQAMETLTLISDAADELRNGLLLAGWVQGRLKHPDAKVRLAALNAISKLGDAQFASFGLSAVKCLDDSDEEVQLAAIAALHRLMPTKAAIPKLTDLTKHKSIRIRAAAVGLVGRLAYFFKDAMPPVIAALEDTTEVNKFNTVRSIALNGLRKCSTDAKDAAPRIVEIIKTETEHEKRWHAVMVLASVAPAEPIIIATLKEWLSSKSPPSRRSQAAGLAWEIAEHCKDTVPDLIAALKMADAASQAQDKSIKQGIVQSLGKIGPAAKNALPVLEQLSDYGDRSFREDLQKTLKAIRGEK